jgi:hypothetical protein
MAQNDSSDDLTEAERKLQQSKNQRRHDTEPTSGGGDDASVDARSLADVVREKYDALDAGDLHQNLHTRDDDLAALVAALEEQGDLERLAEQMNDDLGRSDDVDSRAAFVRAAVRRGIAASDPDVMDEAREGKRQYFAAQADQF